MNSYENDLLNQLNQGFLKLDHRLTILYANPAYLSMMDASSDDIIGQVFPGFTTDLESGFDPALLQEESVQVLRLRSMSGSMLCLEFSFSPVMNGVEEFIGYAVLVRDVTGKTQQMEKLQTGIDTFRDFASSCADWFWETDTRGTFTYVSSEVTDSTGYKPEEIFGRTPFDFMQPREADRVASLFSRVAARGIRFRNLLNEFVTKSGEKRTLSTSGVSILDGEGNLKGYRGSNRDVTKEVESRRRLRNALENTLDILNQIPSGVVITDADLRILHVNAAACSMVGLKPGEAIGRISRDVFCTGCKRECQMAYLSGRTVSCTLTLTGKDGRGFPVLKTVKPVAGSSGQRFIQVITALSHVEEEMQELVSANRMLRRTVQTLNETNTSRESESSGRRALHWNIFQESIYALEGLAGCMDIFAESCSDENSLQLMKYHVCALSDTLDCLRNHHDPSAREFSTETEDFLISSLLDKTVSPFRVSSSGQGVKLRTEYSESSNLLLHGPARGIKAILSRLLDIVPPFSGVFIGACETGEGEHPSALRVSLTVSKPDQGTPAEHLEDRALLIDGNGEFLECGRFASILGSELILEDLQGGGNRVWADFPVTEAAIPSSAGPEPDEIWVTVLSEDRPLTELYAAMLKKAGFKVSPAGGEPWNGFKSGPVRVDEGNLCVLVDSDSPCFQAALAKDPAAESLSRTGKTRLIAVSSLVHSGDVGSYYSTGYSALLLKPLRLGKLKKSILRAFATASGSSFTTDFSL